MNNQGTKFLYSKENSNFYLNAFKNKSCPQSKMTFLLIDKDSSEKKLDKYIDHVTDCEECLKKLNELKVFTEKIDSLIPEPVIPKDIQVEFEGQLSLLMKEVDYQAVRYKPSLWESIKSLLMLKIN
jgi:hypothetical protein